MDNYEPYGEGWEKEMMKFSKDRLLVLLKAAYKGDSVLDHAVTLAKATERLLAIVDVFQESDGAECEHLSFIARAEIEAIRKF